MRAFVIAKCLVNDLDTHDLILGQRDIETLLSQLNVIFHTDQWSKAEQNLKRGNYTDNWDLRLYSTNLVHNPVHVTGILGYVSHVTIYIYHLY